MLEQHSFACSRYGEMAEGATEELSLLGASLYPKTDYLPSSFGQRQPHSRRRACGVLLEVYSGLQIPLSWNDLFDRALLLIHANPL